MRCRDSEIPPTVKLNDPNIQKSRLFYGRDIVLIDPRWDGANGTGAAKACAFSRIPFVEIRGVTDTADHNAASDFEQNLAIAMSNLAILITT